MKYSTTVIPPRRKAGKACNAYTILKDRGIEREREKKK